MRRTGDFLVDAMATVLGVLIAAGVLYMIVLLTGYIPIFEGRAMPIIGFGPITNKDLYRDDKKACFTLHITKLQDATPQNYDFYGNTTEAGMVFSPDMALSAYVALENHERDPHPFVRHDVGVSWVRPWCFEIPGTVADWQTITVKGQARHRRHWFYDTITPVPRIEIPPLKSAPPDAKN